MTGDDQNRTMGEKKEETSAKPTDSEIKIKVEDASEKEIKDQEEEEKPLEKMKKAELIQKIKELQDALEKNNALYLRSQADMENIKKRTKKEKEEWVKYSNETLIKGILPVLDNLEQAISHSHNENALSALREGVELTIKGLMGALEKSGLKQVAAEGESFDPSYHEAVSEQEDETMASGNVLLELQKGYTLHGRLMRPAMVVVSRGKSARSENSDKSPGSAND